MSLDLQDVLDDLKAPSESGDKTIDELYKRLYAEHVLKGIPYVEPIRSKTFGHVKYMMVVHGPKDIAIVDLDRNEQVQIPGDFFDYLVQPQIKKLW
jgi:hypothetical protein